MPTDLTSEDVAALLARAKRFLIYEVFGGESDLTEELADALEAQAKTIERLTREMGEARAAADADAGLNLWREAKERADIELERLQDAQKRERDEARAAGVRVEDLAMVVRMLVHHVPDGKQIKGKAVDYLKRHGLDGSPLRSALFDAPAPPQDGYARGWRDALEAAATFVEGHAHGTAWAAVPYAIRALAPTAPEPAAQDVQEARETAQVFTPQAAARHLLDWLEGPGCIYAVSRSTCRELASIERTEELAAGGLDRLRTLAQENKP